MEKRGQLRSQAKYKRVMNHFSKSMDETETETSSTDTEDLEVDFIQDWNFEVNQLQSYVKKSSP